jgi:hypothetical protein
MTPSEAFVETLVCKEDLKSSPHVHSEYYCDNHFNLGDSL